MNFSIKQFFLSYQLAMGNCEKTCCTNEESDNPDFLAKLQQSYNSNISEISEIAGDKQSKGNKTLVEFANGGVYEGDWDDKLKRHGYGIQKWPDGSKYEGYWKSDRANGFGKLYHSDGDLYEGEWLDDKAHGYGVYTHANGTR